MSGIVFALIMIALVAACAFLLMQAEQNDREYRYLASLTPTPSITPRKVSYIYDYQTPNPTILHLGSGAMGQTVYDVQLKLKELGYYPYEPDAQFGKGTKDAVMAFQADHGLKQDGIVGDETYRMLMSEKSTK